MMYPIMDIVATDLLYVVIFFHQLLAVTELHQNDCANKCLGKK